MSERRPSLLCVVIFALWEALVTIELNTMASEHCAVRECEASWECRVVSTIKTHRPPRQ